MKHNKIEFECRLCKQKGNFSEPQFIAHLDIEHPNVGKNMRSELIYDFGIEKLENEINETTKNLKELKQNLNILRNEKKNVELEELKAKVIFSLQSSNIDKKSLSIIESRKSIHKLKVYLTRGLNKKYRIYLEESKIDYYTPLVKKVKKQKVNKKKKIKKEKNYYDRTTSSVKPIYTPMGNKR